MTSQRKITLTFLDEKVAKTTGWALIMGFKQLPIIILFTVGKRKADNAIIITTESSFAFSNDFHSARFVAIP